MIGIYKITNLVNSKCYIGKSEVSIESRLEDHKRGKHSNLHLQCSMKKYGIENFKFEILEECSIEDCPSRERYWVSYYESYDEHKGYNKTMGGEGVSGFHHTRETIDKISKSNIGLKRSEETKRKIADSKKDRPRTAKELEHLREISSLISGEGNPWYGRSLPEDTMRKAQESHSNKDFREKMSTIAKGRIGSKNGMYGKGFLLQGERNGTYGTTYVWMNDGDSNRRVNPDDVEKFTILGYTRGFIKKKRGDIFED